MAFGPSEVRNYAYLRNLLDAFEKRALEYCATGETPADRFERVKEVRNALISIRVPADVSVRALTAAEVSDPPYPCPPPYHCVGGACELGSVLLSDWPEFGDPAAWDQPSA